MQEQLLRDQAALASMLQAKKVANGPASVSITIDCTAGAGGSGSSGNSGSSSNAVSSTGSAESADTKEVVAQHTRPRHDNLKMHARCLCRAPFVQGLQPFPTSLKDVVDRGCSAKTIIVTSFQCSKVVKKLPAFIKFDLDCQAQTHSRQDSRLYAVS